MHSFASSVVACCWLPSALHTSTQTISSTEECVDCQLLYCHVAKVNAKVKVKVKANVKVNVKANVNVKAKADGFISSRRSVQNQLFILIFLLPCHVRFSTVHHGSATTTTTSTDGDLHYCALLRRSMKTSLQSLQR